MMRKLRKNRKQILNSQKVTSKIDIWFSRASHLSQVGLLAVTIFIYLYTVVPVYEKDKLDREIAKKELELASTKAKLELNHNILRNSLVRSYVSYASAKCTGLLDKPSKPIKLGEKAPSLPERLFDIFDIEIGTCLLEGLKKTKSLNTLSPKEYNFFVDKVIYVGHELQRKRLSRAEQFANYPKDVKTNPELLPVLDESSYDGIAISYYKKIYPNRVFEQKVFQARQNKGFELIKMEYIKDIHSELNSLLKLNWPKPDKE